MMDTADQNRRPRGPLGPVGKCLVALIMLGLVFVGMRAARRSSLMATGALAPAFTLERYGGGTVSLNDLRGKVVLLNFWATWCPPCVEEMPSLVKLAREYEPRGVVLIAANQDDQDTARAAVGVFVARRVPELAAHVVFADRVTSSRYRVQSLPTLYLIGRDGKVLESYSGYASEVALRKKIEGALQ